MAEILACRACLATDTKLLDMYQHDLVSSFEATTGVQMSPSDSLPHQLCSFCWRQLINCCRFTQRSRTAQWLLQLAALQECELTTDYIHNIDRTKHKLSLPYATKTLPQNNIINILNRQDFDQDSMDSIGRVDENYFTDEKYLSDSSDFFLEKVKIEQESDDELRTIRKNEPVKTRSQTRKKLHKKEQLKVIQGNGRCLTAIKNENEDSTVKNEDNTVKNEDDEPKLKDMDFVKLSKEQQIEEILMRKNSVNYLNNTYKCDKCYKGFLSEDTFKNHMDRHDPAMGPYECDVCRMRWPDGKSLRSHARAHEVKYICRLCQHVARSRHAAQEHIRWHEGVKYSCSICGATFDKPTTQLTHLRKLHPSTHVCNICGEKFLGENGLRCHKNKAHRNDTPLQCASCEIQFVRVSALRRHDADGCGVYENVCRVCGSGFSSAAELTAHKCRNAQQCQQCGQWFSQLTTLATHQRKVHRGGASDAGGGAGRTRTNHAPRGGPSMCEICGKKCSSLASLLSHQRTHSGEKPYPCTLCPKRFVMRQHLQIHTRTHTGERPFKCSTCPKGFKHKAALNRHIRVHTGVKPYSCNHCAKAFSQSNSLKTHVATVHLKLPAPYRKPVRGLVQ